MTDDTDRGQSTKRVSELVERVEARTPSRRSFLGNTAKVGSLGVALSAFGVGSGAAKTGMDEDDDEEDAMDEMEEMADGDEDDVSDVDVLNYALTLEHLEAAYYNEFLDEYTQDEIEDSDVAAVLGEGKGRGQVYQRIQQVRDHEEAHVETLSQTIEDLDGEPVEPLEYEFPYDSIEDFAELSATIEAVGVSAYAGAAPLIDSAELIPPALSIHSVEARHTAYFSVLDEADPFPNAFDPARTMDEVLAIATDFVVD